MLKLFNILVYLVITVLNVYMVIPIAAMVRRMLVKPINFTFQSLFRTYFRPHTRPKGARKKLTKYMSSCFENEICTGLSWSTLPQFGQKYQSGWIIPWQVGQVFIWRLYAFLYLSARVILLYTYRYVVVLYISHRVV